MRGIVYARLRVRSLKRGAGWSIFVRLGSARDRCLAAHIRSQPCARRCSFAGYGQRPAVDGKHEMGATVFDIAATQTTPSKHPTRLNGIDPLADGDGPLIESFCMHA